MSRRGESGADILVAMRAFPLCLRSLLAVFTFALVLTFVGCGPSRPPAFVDEAAEVAELELYEGVPRDPAQVRAGPTIRIDDELYYKNPIMVRDDDAHRLGRAIRDPDQYRSHVSGKKCAGFHADYGVMWRGSSGALRTHFCFGCGEVRSESSRASSLVDFVPGRDAALESMFAAIVRSGPQ